MKLFELIMNLDKSERNQESYMPMEDFLSEFDLWWDYIEPDDRLKAYVVTRWLCTDSYVGCLAYFLDDEFVAITTQQGRKCDVEIRFKDLEQAMKMKQYCINLLGNREEEDSYSFLDGNEELGEYYHIGFYDELVAQYHLDRMFYDGIKVIEIEKVKHEEQIKNYIGEEVILKLDNGDTIETEMDKIDIKYMVR